MNNEERNTDMFSPLRSEKPGVTLAELQRHVAAAQASSAFSFRLPALTLAGAGMIGAGYFLIQQNSSNSNQQSKTINTPAVHEVAPISSDIAENKSLPTIEASSSASPTNIEKNILTMHLPNISNSRSAENSKVPLAGFSTTEQTTNAENIPEPAENTNTPVPSKEERTSAVDSTTTAVPIAKASVSFQTDGAITIHDRGAEPEAADRFFGGFQGGILISNLNTLGGGFEIDFDHFWQHVAFRYSSTFGTKTNASELFRKIDGNPNNFPHYNYTQSVVEYTIQFGATIRQGDFWATFSAGPNYTNSSALMTETVVANSPVKGQIYYPQYDTLNSGSVWKGLGASAQATFGYRFNHYIGAQITGFASDHSQVAYGGIVFSVVFGIL